MSDDPIDRLMATLRVSQRNYLATLSEEELEAHRTCQCKLCQFARGVDETFGCRTEADRSWFRASASARWG